MSSNLGQFQAYVEQAHQAMNQQAMNNPNVRATALGTSTSFPTYSPGAINSASQVYYSGNSGSVFTHYESAFVDAITKDSRKDLKGTPGTVPLKDMKEKMTKLDGAEMKNRIAKFL